MDAILFRKCLGINDTRAVSSQRMVTNPRDPEAGHTEFIDCLNVTTTPDGCVEKTPPLVASITHTAPITDISAGKRLLFTDGTDTLEWTTGTTVVNRFPLVSGPMVHTPIDCRVSTATQVFKSPHSSLTMAEALVGTNPDPATSMAFAGMPAFDHAFVYNATLVATNHADPRFLQYSRNYGYDLWNLGDDYIPHMLPVLQSGQIPGCVVALHAGGVSVYTGELTGSEKIFYPCPAINGTLYSGFISEESKHGHVFLGDDGIYLIDGSGKPTNLTPLFKNVAGLNTSYSCATVMDGKYLVFGNTVCIEYDFETKTVLKRSPQGVVGAAIWNKRNYFATGAMISSYGSTIDTSAITTSITLPFSDLGAVGTKSFSCLYFTGEIGECATFTVTDTAGNSWSVQEDGIGAVSEYRIKAPRGDLGNRVSVKIESTSGTFRLEELRAVFMSGKRTR